MRHARVLLSVVTAAVVTTTVSSHEVNVHVAITHKAVDYLVQFRPELKGCTATLKEHLSRGVVDEDAYYQPLATFWPVGRFFFHFLPQLTDVPRTTFGPAVTDATCDSLGWGNGGSPCIATLTLPLYERSSGSRSNEQTVSAAITDLRNPPGSALHNRGLVRLGHYLHLLQDLTSPAHTRNDAHPHISNDAVGIERLGDPSLFEVVNATRTANDIQVPTQPLLTWPNTDTAFANLQQHTASRFWSEKNTLTGNSGPQGVRLSADGYAIDAEGRRIARYIARTGTFTINDVVAREQFDELAPVAVVYSASMLNHITAAEGVSLCAADPLPIAFSVSGSGSASGSTGYYRRDARRWCAYQAPSQEISVSVSGTALTELRGGVEVLSGRGTVSATAPPLKATLIPDLYCSSPAVPATLDTAGISFSGPLGEHVPFQWKDGSSGGSISIGFCEDADCRVFSQGIGPFIRVGGLVQAIDVSFDEPYEESGIQYGTQSVFITITAPFRR